MILKMVRHAMTVATEERYILKVCSRSDMTMVLRLKDEKLKFRLEVKGAVDIR